jgi:hypothetical protein
LDCLDRTNVVQTYFLSYCRLFAKMHLRNWLNHRNIVLSGFDQNNLDLAFNNLWADVFELV